MVWNFSVILINKATESKSFRKMCYLFWLLTQWKERKGNVYEEKKLIVTMLVISLLASGCGVSPSDKATKQNKQKQAKVTDEPFVEVTLHPSQKPAALEDLKELNDNLKIAKDPKSWKKAEGRYEYPISPYGDYSTHDMYYMTAYEAMYDLPLSLQQELSTKELYEFVTRNPYLERYIIMFDKSHTDGVQYAAKHIRGLNEVLERDDMYEAVLEYFEGYQVPKTEPDLNDDKNLSKNLYEYSIVCGTIECSESVLVTYAEKVDDTLRERAKEVLKEKIKQAYDSEYYSKFTSVGNTVFYDDSMPKDMVDAVQAPQKKAMESEED